MSGIGKNIAKKVLKHAIKSTLSSSNEPQGQQKQSGEPNPQPQSPVGAGTSQPNKPQQNNPRPNKQNTIKKKTNKFNLPPGLTKQEAKILKTVKRRAARYDEGFCSCCGIKLGLEPLLGLIPVIGDFMGSFLALLLIRTAKQVGDLPTSLIYQMMMNVLIDLVLGLVPIVGDLADFVFKCNSRNAALLHEFLEDRAKNRSLVLEQGSVEILERYQQPANEEAHILDGRSPDRRFHLYHYRTISAVVHFGDSLKNSQMLIPPSLLVKSEKRILSEKSNSSRFPTYELLCDISINFKRSGLKTLLQ
ncbi:hypothetical protein G9A89_019642 [Geosiphon pyriformis]|nr:hypothetical protein G9A89_019642 [Geosiphon pyriformis]